MNEDLFPEVIQKIPDPPVEPCGFPYFLVAYWPRGKYWSVKTGMFSVPDSPRLIQTTDQMRKAGWTHIHVLKLPESLWTKPEKDKAE